MWRSMPEPDLSSLARLAQNPHAELRPLLLRVQAQGFAAAPSRDALMVASFESIALGLIPLVPDDVLSEVAALLRPLPDAPAMVLAALEARLRRDDGSGALDAAGLAVEEAGRPRLDRAAIARYVALCDDGVDLVLARNADIVLDGRPLATLVDRACSRARLARALLTRAEPTIFDRAALFTHAEASMRDRIREDLEPALAASPHRPSLAAPGTREAVLRAADRRDLAAVVGTVATSLGLAPTPAFDLQGPGERELFGIALRALDLPSEDCIATILTVAPRSVLSVEAVFRFAAVVRSTSREVATVLVRGRDVPQRARPATVPSVVVLWEVQGDLGSYGRTERVSPKGTHPETRASAGNDRAGHRSRSTTGQDRT